MVYVFRVCNFFMNCKYFLVRNLIKKFCFFLNTKNLLMHKFSIENNFLLWKFISSVFCFFFFYNSWGFVFIIFINIKTYNKKKIIVYVYITPPWLLKDFWTIIEYHILEKKLLHNWIICIYCKYFSSILLLFLFYIYHSDDSDVL